MVDIVKRYKCDVCDKELCVNDSENVPSWIVKSEVGDLCPSCSYAWENLKKDFINRMRKECGKDLLV